MASKPSSNKPSPKPSGPRSPLDAAKVPLPVADVSDVAKRAPVAGDPAEVAKAIAPEAPVPPKLVPKSATVGHRQYRLTADVLVRFDGLKFRWKAGRVVSSQHYTPEAWAGIAAQIRGVAERLEADDGG